MKNIALSLALFVSVSLIAGCGYTTSSIGGTGIKSICIEDFKNTIKVTEEPTDKRMYVPYLSGMELEVTKEVINRFLIDGNLKIKPFNQADIILKGTLVDFKKDALRFDTSDNVTEYRLNVVVDIEAINRKTNEELWSEKHFTGESIYRMTGQYAISEQTAVRNAVDDLAERIVERTVEAW